MALFKEKDSSASTKETTYPTRCLATRSQSFLRLAIGLCAIWSWGTRQGDIVLMRAGPKLEGHGG